VNARTRQSSCGAKHRRIEGLTSGNQDRSRSCLPTMASQQARSAPPPSKKSHQKALSVSTCRMSLPPLAPQRQSTAISRPGAAPLNASPAAIPQPPAYFLAQHAINKTPPPRRRQRHHEPQSGNLKVSLLQPAKGIPRPRGMRVLFTSSITRPLKIGFAPFTINSPFSLRTSGLPRPLSCVKPNPAA